LQFRGDKQKNINDNWEREKVHSKHNIIIALLKLYTNTNKPRQITLDALSS